MQYRPLILKRIALGCVAAITALLAVTIPSGAASADNSVCTGTTPAGDPAAFCLWSGTNYSGYEVKVGARWEAPDLRKVQLALGDSLNDSIASVSMAAGGRELDLYSDTNYQGGPYQITASTPSLPSAISRKASSYIVAVAIGTAPTCGGVDASDQPVAFCLWSGYNFTGAEISLSAGTSYADLRTLNIPSAEYRLCALNSDCSWNDQISSVQISSSGIYEDAYLRVTTNTNFGGSSALINSSITDMSTLRLDDAVSSVAAQIGN